MLVSNWIKNFELRELVFIIRKMPFGIMKGVEEVLLKYVNVDKIQFFDNQ